MVVAVDFDGTITVGDLFSRPLRLRPYAKEALQRLRNAGHKLILHSARWSAEWPEAEAVVWRMECEAFLRSHGLWSLFDEVWQRGGKPFADLYLDDRSIRIGEAGEFFGATTWQGIAAAYGLPGQSAPDKAWDGAAPFPRLVLLQSFPTKTGNKIVTAWLIDGKALRDTQDARFTGAWEIFGERQSEFSAIDFHTVGHGARYPWIPIDEIWLDWMLDPDERGAILAHAFVERYWMIEGKPYREAHEIASRFERRVREKKARAEDVIENALIGD